MKIKIIERNKTLISFVIFFILLSLIFPFITFFVGLLQSGEAGADIYLSDILASLANWPALLLKIYPSVVSLDGEIVYALDRALFNPLIIIINALGWGLIGFVVGILLKFWKRYRNYISKKKV